MVLAAGSHDGLPWVSYHNGSNMVLRVQCGGQAEFVAEERTAPYPGLREDDTQRDQYSGLRWKETLYAL